MPCSPVSTSASDDDDGTPHRRRRSTSLSETHSDNPFINGSASSSVESLGDGTPVRRNAIRDSHATGRYRSGRVKGMVENFERSSSVDEGTPDWGKVRRERSNSSASSASSLYETADPDTEPYATATARPSSSRPLPVPPSDSSAFSGSGDDELSMEELLQQAGVQPKKENLFTDEPDTFISTRQTKRRGVHAWEAENEGVDRVTVKRVMPIPGTSIEDLFAVAPIAAASPPSKVEPMMVMTAQDEARLEVEVEETKRMVAELRKRVDMIEQKVNDMEARESEHEARQKEAELKNKQVESAPVEPPAAPPGSIFGQAFKAIFGRNSFPDLENSRARLLSSSFFDRMAEPTTISGLPSYFFLVGLGVCAVVLKVLMRKGAAVGLLTRRR